MEEWSTSIDTGIVDTKQVTLMSDYNIDQLNLRVKECLETKVLPYGLQNEKTEQSIRVKGNSQSLIDFLISDLPKPKSFETIV